MTPDWPDQDNKEDMFLPLYINLRTSLKFGDRGSTVVKVLRYKSEGGWFDPR
jgi:hypothetical protein